MILNKNLQHMHIIRKVFLFPIRIKNKIFHFPLFRGCGNFFVIFQDGAQNPGRSSAKKLKLTSVTLIDLRIYHEFFQNFPTTLNVSHELFIMGKNGAFVKMTSSLCVELVKTHWALSKAYIQGYI